MKKQDAAKNFVQHMSSYLPKFTDIFDEETFYIFVFCLVCITILAAFIASRFITLKDADHIE